MILWVLIKEMPIRIITSRIRRGARERVNAESEDNGTVQDALAKGKYAPASQAEAQAVLDLCIDALGMIPYVEITSGTIQESNRERIFVTCHPRTCSFTPDMIRLDVMTVWKSVVVGENTSVHLFTDIETGYTFRFAILYGGKTYLTGCFLIEPPPQQDGTATRLSRVSSKKP